jgi:hypothetical protein
MLVHRISRMSGTTKRYNVFQTKYVIKGSREWATSRWYYPGS